MIYIVEDRFERKKTYQDIVDRYSDIVKFAQIEPQRPLLDFVEDNFSDAEYILFHKSYTLPSNGSDISVNEILKAFKDLFGEKLIIFSGGIEKGSKNGIGEISINADVMYNNLDLFLKNFKETGCFVSEILIWGKNYNLNQLLSKQMSVHIDHFLNEDLSKSLDSEDIEDLMDDLSTEGFDIKEDVLRKMDSSDGIITLDDIRNIIQTRID